MYFTAATGDSKDVNDPCRKPKTGMFDVLKQMLSCKDIDMEESFYCGDGAGRR